MANPCAFFPKLQIFDPRNLYEGWDSFFPGIMTALSDNRKVIRKV